MLKAIRRVSRLAVGSVLATIALRSACGQYEFLTLAGLAGHSGRADGVGSAARFWGLSGIAVDAAGNLYVADTWNHAIRKITPATAVSTWVGLPGTASSEDGIGPTARFSKPAGLAADSAGNIYVADMWNHAVRKVTPAGRVTTVAGLAGAPGSADGAGSAARFTLPSGVAVDGAGNVYVADSYNHTVRKITPAGTVSTLAGLAGNFGSFDDWGNAARFWSPMGVAADSAGNVYVADTGNRLVRKIWATGLITTLAGFTDPLMQWVKHSYTGEDAFRDACLRALQGRGATSIWYLLQNSPDGWNLWLDGNVVLGMYMLGTPSPVDGHRTDDEVKRCNSLGITTQIPVLFNSPDSFAGAFSYHDAYLQWVADSINWAPEGQFIVCMGIHVDRNQTISTAWTPDYVNQMAGKIKQYTGSRFKVAIHAGYPQCITWGQGANIDIIYVDSENHSAPEMAQIVSIVSQQTGKPVEIRNTGSVDGIGWNAQFNAPTSLAVDNLGNVYVTDSGDHTIRKVTQAGVVTTLAGLTLNPGSADGTGRVARFNGPNGIAVDTSAHLFVADTYNAIVRMGVPPPITVQANPATNGTVSGGGRFAEGAQQVLTATPRTGWTFTTWNDGDVSNPRTITVPATGGSYTANFARINAAARFYLQDFPGSTTAWALNGQGLLQQATTLGDLSGWKLKAAGDVNRDSRADLFWQLSDGWVAAWLSTAANSYVGLSLGNVGAWELRAAADLDGDGSADLIWQNPDGWVVAWLMNANLTQRAGLILGNLGDWKLKAAGDVNHDGKADLFWQHASGWVVAWLSQPAGNYQGQELGNPGAWGLQTMSDVDGDGIPDLVWQHPSGGVAVWYLTTNGVPRDGKILGNIGTTKVMAAE